MKTEEGRLKDYVKKQLDLLHAYRYMPVPSGYGQQTLDFLCCIDGRFIGIETKAEGKEPTARQSLCIEEIKAAGGIAFWCDSAPSFMLAMKEHGFFT